MSIVLVIISLLVGGVLAGREMIHITTLRSVITDINNYKQAIHIFEAKYSAFPGDFKNAYDFWGTSCHVNPSRCNGNGNFVYSTSDEQLQFWNHLQLAGIIDGSLTGSQDNSSAPTWAAIGGNIPAAPIQGAGYEIEDGCWSSWPCFGRNGNLIMLGMVPNGDNYLNAGAVPPLDAEYIDRKIDDGKADGGHVRVARSYTQDTGVFEITCTGVNPSSATSGSYDFSVTSSTCRLAFFLD